MGNDALQAYLCRMNAKYSMNLLRLDHSWGATIPFFVGWVQADAALLDEEVYNSCLVSCNRDMEQCVMVHI